MQVTPLAAPQAASPAPGMAAGHGGDAFAALLSSRQEAAPPAPQAGPNEAARDESSNAVARRAEAQRIARQAAERSAHERADAAGQAPAPKAALDDETAAAGVDETAGQAGGEEAVDQAEDRDAEPVIVDPALLGWLAALNRPAAAAADAPSGLPADDTRQPAASRGTPAGRDAASRLLWRDAPGLGGEAAVRGAAGGETARLHAEAATQTIDLASAVCDIAANTAGAEQAPLAALHARLADTAPAEAGRATDALAALTGTAPTASAERSAAPLGVTLRTPATAPEFREALAAQVTVLARDGVQQAKLHLNPADMGPISVHIALQGTQAQVNFGVDSAATRDIIQAGLPELAAALSEAGLTLAGGGVAQHAHGGASQDGGGGGRHGGGRASVTDSGWADTDDPVAAAQQQRSSLRAALGGVDLFA